MGVQVRGVGGMEGVVGLEPSFLLQVGLLVIPAADVVRVVAWQIGGSWVGCRVRRVRLGGGRGVGWGGLPWETCSNTFNHARPRLRTDQPRGGGPRAGHTSG